METEMVLEVDGLCKRYGDTVAVDGVSVAVDGVSLRVGPRPSATLTEFLVKCMLRPMPVSVEVLDRPETAVAALLPPRARLLAELGEPASAAALAARMGSTRQRVNYHLRALADHGLVTATGERRHGGLVERLLVATANSYVVAPVALGAAGADPGKTPDRLGARYLVAVAGRIVSEVGALLRGASEPPTFALDAEIGLSSAAARLAFVEDLANAVAAVAQRHHVNGGKAHRLLVTAHPIPDQTEKEPT